MGKFSQLLSVVFLPFLFWGCHSYVEVVNIKPYIYKADDYITKELNVYEPEESLYPILDSINIKTEECPEYQNRKEKVFFFFCIEDGSYSDPEEKWGNPHIGIFVNYYLFRFSDFRSTLGVFGYKGYDFYIDEIFANILLKKTDRTITITCVTPEKYHFDPLYRGDGDMYWWYGYKHESLINIQYGRCPTPNL